MAAAEDKIGNLPQSPIMLALVAAFAALVAGIFSITSDIPLRLWTVVNSNQILQALVVPSVLGSALFAIRSIFVFVQRHVLGKFWCSITIQSTDENFATVLDFLSKKLEESGRGASSLMVQTPKKKWDRKSWRKRWLGLGEDKPVEMEYKPDDTSSVSFVQFKGHRIVVTRTKGEMLTTGWERKPLRMERLTLSCYGGKTTLLREFVAEAMRQNFREERGVLNVYVLTNGWPGGWEKALSKKQRSKDSVILDNTLADDLVADARDFLSRSDWYAERGIPYRRGYLLHGPPGCGKTSFSQVLASELMLDVCMLSLSNKGLDDTKLAESLREAPSNAILLLEDVDAVFVERSVAASSSGSGVTFSGLLNAIDGVASQEGRMFMMTTNHIEKLDPALIRPGRCDVRVEVRRASKEQMRRMFLRFFPAEPQLAGQFAQRLPAHELSMAQIQGHMLENKDSAQRAVDRIPKLLQSNKPVAVETVPLYSHLRRLGLEQYTWIFEYHGISTAEQLAELKSGDIDHWCMSLHCEDGDLARLKALLEPSSPGGKALREKELATADLSTIREAFLAAFPTHYERQHGEQPPQLRRQGSGTSLMAATAESSEAEAQAAAAAWFFAPPAAGEAKGDANASEEGTEEEEVSFPGELVDRLSHEFVNALTRGGKGAISLWQLRRLLQLYSADPQKAVEQAPQLTAPRPLSSYREQWLSTFQYLSRLGEGLARHATALEAEGFVRAHSLLACVDNGDALDQCGVGSADKEKLLLFLKREPKHRSQLVGQRLVPRLRVQALVMAAFSQGGRFAQAPAAADGEQGEGKEAGGRARAACLPRTELRAVARALSVSLSDELGRGLVSYVQLQEHFARHAGDPVGARDGLQELLSPKQYVAPPPAPAVESTEWIHVWLKSHDLDDYSSNFIDQCITTRGELTAMPLLVDDQLKALGVDKLGHRRKLLRLISQLVAKGAGESKQGDIAPESENAISDE